MILIWEVDGTSLIQKTNFFQSPPTPLAANNPFLVAGQFIPVLVSPEKPKPIDDLILLFGGQPPDGTTVAFCIDVPSSLVITGPDIGNCGETQEFPQGELTSATSGHLSLLGYDIGGELAQGEQLVLAFGLPTAGQVQLQAQSIVPTAGTLPNATSFGFDILGGIFSGPAPDVGFCGPGNTVANAGFGDIALGNFDQSINPDANVQAAVGVGYFCSPSNSTPVGYLIWDITNADGGGPGFGAAPSSHVKIPAGAGSQFVDASIAAGDSQGRSLILGEPEVVRVSSHSQPEIVLGVGPMHVDWAVPVPTATNPNPVPEVLNLSAIPDGFLSQYDTATKGSDQSSQMSTTSYAASTKETVGGSVSYGGLDADDFKVSFSASLEQAHTRLTSGTTNDYTSTDFDASTETGFGDVLWFTSKRFNVYSYPVLGQLRCPNETPNCDDGEKLPLYVQFSGPDMIFKRTVAANNVEWYQPQQESGNVFSYPWVFEQLKNQHGGFIALTSENPTFLSTDDTVTVETAQWSQMQGQDQSNGSSKTHSFDASVSVSGKASIFGAGVSADASFAYNRSTAVSSLNTTVNTVGESKGIVIEKPGTFLDPSDYQYGFQPFIFGQSNPKSTMQNILLGTQIATTGTLWTAFTANPTLNASGGWWTGTYTKPDVALNHPARWQINKQAPPTGTPPLNCLFISTDNDEMDCANFNTPEPSELWTSEFYWMRGLLISPANADGMPVGGPQMTVTTAGQELALQARVYNYSLTGMDDGSAVKVRFYGQKWDHSTSQPMGPSFLIGEDTLDPLPGFAASGAPNWDFANVTFDTTPYGGDYLVFWVLVWTEDSNGALAAEMAGHGLSEIPGTLTSIPGGGSLLEPFSNNVGLYKQAFYVFPAATSCVSSSNQCTSSPCETGLGPGQCTVNGDDCGCMLTTAPTAGSAATASDADENGGLVIESTSVTPSQVVLNGKVVVSALLRTGGASVDGIQVLFYDRDPLTKGRAFDLEYISHIRADDTGGASVDGIQALFYDRDPLTDGKAFDLEYISHIRADDMYQVRVPFRPRTCGAQTIFVEVLDGSSTLQGTAELDVNCVFRKRPFSRPMAYRSGRAVK